MNIYEHILFKYSVLKIIFPVIMSYYLFGCQSTTYESLNTYRGQIVEVIDAGTAMMVSQGTRKNKVNIEGIKCPSLDGPDRAEAKKAAEDLMLHKQATIIFSSGDRNTGYTGTVLVGEINVGEQLVKGGYCSKIGALKP